MTDQEIISLINKGQHSKALTKLYKIYPAVQKYILDYGGTSSDAEDIFQDGLVIFMDKTNNQNFQLSSSISTYLFGICKNLCREKHRQVKQSFIEGREMDEHTFSKETEEFLEEERKYQSLDKILIESGKKCMDLLTMFYYQNLSMKAIAAKLGFSSETSAKTQKYKCLEKARTLTTTILMEQKQTVS